MSGYCEGVGGVGIPVMGDSSDGYFRVMVAFTYSSAMRFFGTAAGIKFVKRVSYSWSCDVHGVNTSMMVVWSRQVFALVSVCYYSYTETAFYLT